MLVLQRIGALSSFVTINFVQNVFDGRGPAGLGLVSSALSCSLVSIFTDKLFLAVRNKVFYSSIAVLGAALPGAAGVIKLALGSVDPRT